MKIVMVSTVMETTPPKKYGGSERVISEITEGMVEKGHQVFLFAAKNSKTKAILVDGDQKALFRLDLTEEEYLYYKLDHIVRAVRFAEKIKADIIHFHEFYPVASICQLIRIPCLITLHLSIDPTFISKHVAQYLLRNKDLNYISISNSQRKLPLNFVANIYNGTSVADNAQPSKKGDYLFWVGRITSNKGTDKAIRIAKRTGMKLIIAGKYLKLGKHRSYFRQLVRPFIDHKKIEYIGEVDQIERNRLMRGAMAFVNPIDWAEPFGLVITEAMAQGTPVVTFANGSPEEIISDRMDGFLVNQRHDGGKKFQIHGSGINGMVEAINKINKMSEAQYHQTSKNCINKVREKFSNQRMVSDYEAVYKRIIKNPQ